EHIPQYFSERLVRLPHSRFCYRPPDYAPAVAEPPALSRGYVTFGCFNNLAKINPEVIALWAEILAAAPGSRLRLKSLALGDEGTAARYRALFAEQGIGPERLEFSGFSSHAEMLAQYGEMDIALDPFPFTGGLTTCEALWMGVPLVTLASGQLVSRQSASLLANLEKSEWIAQTPGQYRDAALKLASDPGTLAALRKSLRDEMARSPLCDGAGFTKDLESAYQRMWQNAETH
ncbi:MAG: hypothetical protein K8F27_15660, partial [Sulfuricellaceae bacterium]|nr:hypothetical protein [Sulfuricellaceae bacterium]